MNLLLLSGEAARSKEVTITPTDSFDNYLISEIDRTAQLDTITSYEADKGVNGTAPIMLGGPDGVEQMSFNLPSKYVGLTISFLPDESASGEFSQIFAYGDLKLGISVSETEFSMYRYDDPRAEWVLLADRFEYLRQGGLSRYAFLSVVKVDDGVYLALNARVVGYLENLRLYGSVTVQGGATLPVYWGPTDVYETVPGFIQKFEDNLTKEKFSGMTDSQKSRHLLRQGFVKAPPVEEGQLSYQEEAWLLSQSLNRRIWEGVVLSVGGDYSAFASGQIPHMTLDIVPNLQGRPWRYPWDKLDAEDNYLEILDGYLMVPESGEYTFWVTGDDYASFYIGSVSDPDNLKVIAETQVALLKNNWDIDGPGRSAPIFLEQGQVYRIRTIHHETTGENHFSVGWAKPSDGAISFPAEMVPSEYLSSLASGQPGVMPRALQPFGQELLLQAPSREPEFQKLSSKVIDPSEVYEQLSGSISSSETIELTDFDAGGWALHASLGWLWSDSTNFPWIWKDGSSGYFEPTTDEWLQYTQSSSSPQVFYKTSTNETLKVYSFGIFYVPEFTGDTPQTINKTVGDSHTFSATLKRYFTPSSTYWKLDGAQVATGTIVGDTMSYALSNMMKDDDEGVYAAYISAPGGTDTSAPITLNISKAEQATVTISSVPTSLAYLSIDDLNASGGSGTGSFGYEVEDPSKGQIVNGDDIKALSGTGTVRVRAYRAADANYNIKYSNWSAPISLVKVTQATVYISSVPASLIYLLSDDLNASGGSGTGSFGYEVENTSLAQIVNGDDVKALSGTGTVRVRAFRAADANYNAKYSEWSASITLDKAEQASVFITSVPASLPYSVSDDLNASGGSGSGSFGYEVDNPAKATIVNTDDVQALSGTGSVKVRSFRFGDDNYNIKYSNWSTDIVLLKMFQSPPWISSPLSATRGESVYFTAYGGGYQGTLEWNSNVNGQGWTACGNPLTVGEDWYSLNLRVRWTGNENYNPSGYSVEQVISLLAGSQSAPASILPLTARRGEFVRFSTFGGGEVGLSFFEYSLDGSSWSGFDETLYINPNWDNLYIRSYWSGDGYFDSSQKSIPFNINLLSCDQSPPELLTPTAITAGDTVNFSLEGGGQFGDLIIEYQADGGNWIAFTNPLTTDSALESLKIRAKWAGNTNVNESQYSEEFSIWVLDPDSPDIVPISPEGTPDAVQGIATNSQTASNWEFEAGLEQFDRTPGSVTIIESMASVASVGASNSNYEVDVITSNTPQFGNPTIYQVRVENKESVTNNYYILPYILDWDTGKYTYVGSSDLGEHKITVGGDLTEYANMFYHFIDAAFNGGLLYFGVFSSVPPFGPPSAPSSSNGNLSINAGAVSGITAPDLDVISYDKQTKEPIVTNYGHQFPQFPINNNLEPVLKDPIPVYLNHNNNFTLRVQNNGNSVADNVKVITKVKRDGSIIYSIQQTVASVSVEHTFNTSIDGDLFVIPGKYEIEFEVSSSSQESQTLNNTVSVDLFVPEVDTSLGARGTGVTFDDPTSDNPLAMTARLISNGSPPVANTWYKVRAYGYQGEGIAPVPLTDWEDYDAGAFNPAVFPSFGPIPAISSRVLDPGTATFYFTTGFQNFYKDAVFVWFYSWQEDKYFASNWIPLRSPEIGFVSDGDNDGTPDEGWNGKLEIGLESHTGSRSRLLFSDELQNLPMNGIVKIRTSPYGSIRLYNSNSGGIDILSGGFEKSWDLSDPTQRSDLMNLVSQSIWVAGEVPTFVDDFAWLEIEIFNENQNLVLDSRTTVTVLAEKIAPPQNLMSLLNQPEGADLRLRLNNVRVFESVKFGLSHPNVQGGALGKLRDGDPDYIFMRRSFSSNAINSLRYGLKNMIMKYNGVTHTPPSSVNNWMLFLLEHELSEIELEISNPQLTGVQKDARSSYNGDQLLKAYNMDTIFPDTWSLSDHETFSQGKYNDKPGYIKKPLNKNPQASDEDKIDEVNKQTEDRKIWDFEP